MTFGKWLGSQKQREDWIGDLARAAAKDPRFPWTGKPLDMWDRVRTKLGTDAEALRAMEAAADEWHGGPYSIHTGRGVSQR